jgi:hypothetical protein
MTEHNLFSRIKRGDGIVAQFGRSGHQYAIVFSTSVDRVMVVKWRANSRRWTKPVKLWPGDLVRRANEGEFKADPVPSSIWNGR